MSKRASTALVWTNPRQKHRGHVVVETLTEIDYSTADVLVLPSLAQTIEHRIGAVVTSVLQDRSERSARRMPEAIGPGQIAAARQLKQVGVELAVAESIPHPIAVQPLEDQVNANGRELTLQQ